MIAAYGPVAPHSGGGSLIPLFVVLACLTWLGLQFRPTRRAVWRARIEALAPLGALLRADALALWATVVDPWRVRRARGEMDEGLEDLLG